MSNVRRFFNAMMMLVLFMVILVVFSIGYKTFFVDAGHSAMGKSEAAMQSQTNTADQTNDAANMQAAQQQYTGNMQVPANSTPVISPKDDIQKNKEMLEGIISKLNDTMQYLTMEPIATGSTENGAAVNNDTNNGDAQAQTVSMQDMGLRYDAEKMAKLHSGMYKIAVGTAMLNKLGDNFSDQMKATDQNMAGTSQFYSSLYHQTVENKAILTNALTHMSDAPSLLNLNPYVSENGIPYDSERMTKLHQSVLSLADGMATASMLESNLAMQAENYETYVNVPSYTTAPANSMPVDAASASHTATVSGAGVFGGLNIDYIGGILPYAFGAFFLLGMIGYILNQARSRSKAEIDDAKPGEVS